MRISDWSSDVCSSDLPAVRIGVAVAEAGLERRAGGMAAKIERRGARQRRAAAEMIVDEQPEPQHPARPQPLAIGQDETHRVDEMRRDSPQPLAFLQGLAHQGELRSEEHTSELQ